ncbi:ABC transporter ATP-binding protein [Haloarcula salina]|uniref:ABC transporter ATP-binding protein n=1 Tax=Haloarcula salina TaxID=1429914 RepID=A0AA41KFC8_9EURY|nr:ABC transporter ATP-binding protein [Haloarcula salina]MBV0901932.1 ABC transporter ATP-binding protein [Haloarcula salina]
MTDTVSSPAPTVAVEGVHKRYETTDGAGTTALADVSFTIDPGEFVTVVGPSGCGKTTLARLVGGFESPTSGRVLVDETPVTSPAPDRAMVFQAYHLFPWLSVQENVAFGLVEQGVAEDVRNERVEAMLELVGLSDRASAYPAELSGGMKQRVGLARALAVDPGLLLMDEPFGSVDSQTRRRLQRELLDIWRTVEKTVVFVTHDIQEAVLMSDRVLVLTGTPGRVRDDVTVELPRPRDRTDDAFIGYVDTLFDLVETTI